MRPRPSKKQIAAVAAVLEDDWDRDGAKAAGLPGAYTEWGAGIADMINHEPPPATLVEYLGVLEEQLGLPPSPVTERERWAGLLQAAVNGAAG
jgi:hypothetical protein